MPFIWLLPVALIIATAIAAEFFGHPLETPTSTLQPVVHEQPAEPTPTPTSPPEPTILGTKATEQTLTVTPSPTTKSTPSSSPLSSPDETISISFLDLPSTLPAGEKTKITVKIDGPAGTKGNDAKIKVKYHTNTEKNSSSSSVKNDISNSFGRFTIPAEFSMHLSLGSEPAPVEFIASAEIDGKVIETTRTVNLH